MTSNKIKSHRILHPNTYIIILFAVLEKKVPTETVLLLKTKKIHAQNYKSMTIHDGVVRIIYTYIILHECIIYMYM